MFPALIIPPCCPQSLSQAHSVELLMGCAGCTNRDGGKAAPPRVRWPWQPLSPCWARARTSGALGHHSPSARCCSLWESTLGFSAALDGSEQKWGIGMEQKSCFFQLQF